MSHKRKLISINETRKVSMKLKKENVLSSLNPTKPPTKKVAPKIISIRKDNINIIYWNFSKLSSKILKRIPMLLRNNFNDNRTKAVSSTLPRRSNNLSQNIVWTKTAGLSTDNSMDSPVGIKYLSGWLRCYVENFMLLEESKEIIIIWPQQNTTFQDYAHKPIIIGNSTFNKYYARIIASPYSDKIQDWMCIHDINIGFGNGKYVCYISLTGKNQNSISIRHLLTWTEVLNGGILGIQVWKKGDVYRDISIAFHNATHNPDNIKIFLGKLYKEIYGDYIQLFHLMCVFYRTLLTHSTLFEAEYVSFLKIYEPIVLSQHTLPRLLSSIDKAFGDAIQECCYSF